MKIEPFGFVSTLLIMLVVTDGISSLAVKIITEVRTDIDGPPSVLVPEEVIFTVSSELNPGVVKSEAVAGDGGGIAVVKTTPSGDVPVLNTRAVDSEAKTEVDKDSGAEKIVVDAFTEVSGEIEELKPGPVGMVVPAAEEVSGRDGDSDAVTITTELKGEPEASTPVVGEGEWIRRRY